MDTLHDFLISEKHYMIDSSAAVPPKTTNFFMEIIFFPSTHRRTKWQGVRNILYQTSLASDGLPLFFKISLNWLKYKLKLTSQNKVLILIQT